MPLFVDPTSTAAAPGRLNPDRLYFAYLDNSNLLSKLAGYVFSFVPWFIAKWIPIVKDFKRAWISRQEHFKYGNLCAALVIDQRENKVAVYTNLTRFNNMPDVPVIKVVIAPLALVKERQVYEGSRLVAVSLYGNSQGLPYSWSEFHPIVVDCFGDNAKAALKAQSRISEDSWKGMERALQQLPRSPEPGMYYVDV